MMSSSPTAKKITASVLGGLILMLVGAFLNQVLAGTTKLANEVYNNSRRITVIETELSAISQAINSNKGQLEKNRDELAGQIEKNRQENRDEHKEIIQKLDRLSDKVGK